MYINTTSSIVKLKDQELVSSLSTDDMNSVNELSRENSCKKYSYNKHNSQQSFVYLSPTKFIDIEDQNQSNTPIRSVNINSYKKQSSKKKIMNKLSDQFNNLLLQSQSGNQYKELEESINQWLDENNIMQVQPDLEANYYQKEKNNFLNNIQSLEITQINNSKHIENDQDNNNQDNKQSLIHNKLNILNNINRQSQNQQYTQEIQTIDYQQVELQDNLKQFKSFSHDNTNSNSNSNSNSNNDNNICSTNKNNLDNFIQKQQRKSSLQIQVQLKKNVLQGSSFKANSILRRRNFSQNFKLQCQSQQE